ncbi:MAG: 23S rRNA (uracil(1939)-C(5))-methyltransferase RlmD [Bacteroidaceae bacterium]|nr:23S rRNA (uracil(1939)-C(5))-methyltransferase RlmD [Bacteroidaceae bacterium]
MSRKRKELPLYEGVTIEAVAAEGKALVHVDDLVVFVPFVIPGDVVDIKLTKKKHSYAEAEVVRLQTPSPDRLAPFCPHYGVCGGCKWQILPYELQLKAKQKQIIDALTRIGKVELPECQPILGSEKTQEYRNKLEFGFSNKRWLTKEQIRTLPPRSETDKEQVPTGAVGYHAGGSWDKILPIEECHLMEPVNDRIRLSIRDYAYQHNLSFFDAREHSGLLRGMMIRTSNTGGLMLLVQFCISTSEERLQALDLLQYLKETFPEITSLLYVNNQKFNDTFGDLPIEVFSGDDHIYLAMENLRFKVRAKSFYQTNTEQAYHLYSVARKFAGLTGNETVYDLYTGTGTIANFVASQARQVIGIDYVEDAIADARINSEVNGLSNTEFFAGDMKDILTDEFITKHGRPDVIITDPPRAGMHSDVVKTILRASPLRIVYVSCNPATQARDLNLLDEGYRVNAIQPVDMFPHTQHVENVVLLEKRLTKQ